MTHDAARRGFDPAHDRNLKRTAIALVSQIPDNLDDAERVLEHARALVATFLRGDEAEAPASNVLSLVRQDGSEVIR